MRFASIDEIHVSSCVSSLRTRDVTLRMTLGYVDDDRTEEEIMDFVRDVITVIKNQVDSRGVETL